MRRMISLLVILEYTYERVKKWKRNKKKLYSRVSRRLKVCITKSLPFQHKKIMTIGSYEINLQWN